MYEELVKRLRRYVEIERSEHHGAELEAEAADAIEELSREIDIDNAAMTAMDAAIPRWIPVTEPPKDDGWYQVYAPGYSGGSSSGLKNIRGNMYSAFKNGKWSIEVGYHKRPGCVKAWMPLPEPPKEG